MTLGNHQCSGEAPIFIIRGVIIVIDMNVSFSKEKILSERDLIIIIINNNVEEAKACTIKYFIEASVVYTLLCINIIGINDSKLISNPIHAPNHELDDTEIKTPTINVVDRKIFVELLDIRELRITTHSLGTGRITWHNLSTGKWTS
jgi:hypothetical protein